MTQKKSKYVDIVFDKDGSKVLLETRIFSLNFFPPFSIEGKREGGCPNEVICKRRWRKRGKKGERQTVGGEGGRNK